MTTKQAIEQLNRLYGELSEENKIALDVLMDKQIPKKPNYHYYHINCPACGHDVFVGVACIREGRKYDYCTQCGQAIDWSEE